MPNIPAGGPSTINGVLYQMLWSLLKTLEFYVQNFDGTASSGPSTATIILEPIDGGGDLQRVDGSLRIVEQIKSSSTSATWSLRDVIEEVIPDLIKAVDLDKSTRYKLVTEGRIGNWSEVLRAFESLRALPNDRRLLASLDNTKLLPFGRGVTGGRRRQFWDEPQYTLRSIFEKIVKVVRAKKVGSDIKLLRRQVWHVLANFEILGQQQTSILESQIDNTLRDLTPHSDKLQTIRAALIYDLQIAAAGGDAHVNARTLLAKYDLDVTRLSDSVAVTARCRNRLRSQLELLGYREGADVRKTFPHSLAQTWSQENSVLILTGESGQGKTWTLQALALEMSAQMPAVLTAGDEDAGVILSEVAAEYYNFGLGHSGTKTLQGLVVDHEKKTSGGQWLAVFIDGVQDEKTARALARVTWDKWGIKLGVSCQPNIAQAMAAPLEDRAQIKPVRDFTNKELSDYLFLSIGEGWANIAPDLRQMLRKPLLTSLYSLLAKESGISPTNEYSLYKKFWDRIGASDEYTPLVKNHLRRLALSFLDGKLYPWTLSQIEDSGVTGDLLAHFIRVGWVRPAGRNDRYEFAHDRLLNWAVAEAVYEAYLSDQWSQQQTIQLLSRLFSSDIPISGRALNYAPMDMLWLAAQDADRGHSLINEFLQSIEEKGGWRGSEIMDDLIPTLGNAIIPAIAQRLSMIEKPNGWADHDASRYCNIIIAIGGRSASSCALRLLASDDHINQFYAMRILASCPNPEGAQRVWDIHCVARLNPDEYFGNKSSWALSQYSYAALKACATANRTWLEHTIDKCDAATDPIWDLAYIVATSQSEELWSVCKTALFDKMPSHKLRSLAHNIAAYKDREYIDWLVGHLPTRDDSVGLSALYALSKIDIGMAIGGIERVDLEKLVSTRKWCFRNMLFRANRLLQAKMVDLLEQAENPWRLANVYDDNTLHMSSRVAKILISSLDNMIGQALLEYTTDSQTDFYYYFRLLCEISGRESLALLRENDDNQLSKHLYEWMLKIGGRRRQSHPRLDRELGIKLLYKVSNRYFVRIINSWLVSDSSDAKLDALEHCWKDWDAETIRTLCSIASTFTNDDNISRMTQAHAFDSLAQMNCWVELIPLLAQCDCIYVNPPDYRRHIDEPIDNALIIPVISEFRTNSVITAGGVMVLGYSNSAESIAVLQEVVKSETCDKSIKWLAAVVLGQLGDPQGDAVSFLEALLESDKGARSYLSDLNCNHFSGQFYGIVISLPALLGIQIRQA